MLVLSRRVGEALILDKDIKFIVVERFIEKIRFRIESPRVITAMRSYLYPSEIANNSDLKDPLLCGLNEGVLINGLIAVYVLSIDKSQFRLGVNAPRDILIDRAEIALRRRGEVRPEEHRRKGALSRQFGKKAPRSQF